MQVELETWDGTEGKGVDDALAAGAEIVTLSGAEAQAEVRRIASAADTTGSSSPLLTRMSDVEPEAVRWLWPGRIPLGKLTVLDGDPGLGKSFLTLDLAARVSQGWLMPDGARSDVGGPAGVVLCSAEDGLADTIRPRLDAAGADCKRVVALEAVRHTATDSAGEEQSHDSEVTLGHVEMIEKAIGEAVAVLMIVDPLMAFLPTGTDAHKDAEVRSTLRPLSAVAERTGAAVVVVRHLNKAAGGNPLYRGGGSIGITGAARSVLLVARDPDDPSGERRILAVTKTNLAAPAVSLAYRIAAGDGAPVLSWEGRTEHTAAGLLAASHTGTDGTQKDTAAEWLRLVLADGPMLVDDLKKEAAAAGVAWRTLERAKKQVGVIARRSGFSGPWEWLLSEPTTRTIVKQASGHRPPSDPIDRQPQGVAVYGEDGGLWTTEQANGMTGRAGVDEPATVPATGLRPGDELVLE